MENVSNSTTQINALDLYPSVIVVADGVDLNTIRLTHNDLVFSSLIIDFLENGWVSIVKNRFGRTGIFSDSVADDIINSALEKIISPEPATREPGEKCKCEFCAYWLPCFLDISNKIHDAKWHPSYMLFLQELFDRFLCLEEDNEYMKAKLSGTWPGWEWLPEEIKKRQKR